MVGWPKYDVEDCVSTANDPKESYFCGISCFAGAVKIQELCYP